MRINRDPASTQLTDKYGTIAIQVDTCVHLNVISLRFCNAYGADVWTFHCHGFLAHPANARGGVLSVGLTSEGFEQFTHVIGHGSLEFQYVAGPGVFKSQEEGVKSLALELADHQA